MYLRICVLASLPAYMTTYCFTCLPTYLLIYLPAYMVSCLSAVPVRDKRAFGYPLPFFPSHWDLITWLKVFPNPGNRLLIVQSLPHRFWHHFWYHLEFIMRPILKPFWGYVNPLSKELKIVTHLLISYCFLRSAISERPQNILKVFV